MSNSFEGFEIPNTTPVPDIVFDELLSKLTGNELKVLLYIIRRTYGFGKNADAISLSQFRKGITTQDGKVLDKGCGIEHNRTILAALTSLEKSGYVASKKRQSHAGDSDATIYRLRFKSAAKEASRAQSDSEVVTPRHHLVTSSNDGSYSTSPRWLPQVTTVVTSSNQQETVIQYTDKQETVIQQEVTNNISGVDASVANATTPTLFENLYRNFDDVQKGNASPTATGQPPVVTANSIPLDASTTAAHHNDTSESLSSSTTPVAEPQAIITQAEQQTARIESQTQIETSSFADESSTSQPTEQGASNVRIDNTSHSHHSLRDSHSDLVEGDPVHTNQPPAIQSSDTVSAGNHSVTNSNTVESIQSRPIEQAKSDCPIASWTTKQQTLIEKPKQPQMPPADMKWCAEKMVQITEACRICNDKQGAYFSTELKGNSKKSQRDRQIEAAKKVLALGITEEQYVKAYNKRNDDWWNKNRPPLSVEDMYAKTTKGVIRITEVLEELESRSVPTSNSKIRPFPSSQQSSSNTVSSFRAPTGMIDHEEMQKMMNMDPATRKAYALEKKRLRLEQEQQQRAAL